MANRSKDYQDSRVARLNFAVLPSVKDDLSTLAAMRKITLNELGNQIFTEYIKKNEKRLSAYAELMAGFDDDDSDDSPLVKNPSVPVTPSKTTLTDEQRQTAINKIVKFINENQDKVIDENEEKTASTIGIRIPARRGYTAFVAVIANTVKHLIDDETIKTLVKRTTVKGKKDNNIIRIEESALLASNNSTETDNG